MKTTPSNQKHRIYYRIIFLIFIVFLIYSLALDEERAILNTIRHALKALAKAF